jgi:hypothetical protein
MASARVSEHAQDMIMQLGEFFQDSMRDPVGPVNELYGSSDNKTRRVTQ